MHGLVSRRKALGIIGAAGGGTALGLAPASAFATPFGAAPAYVDERLRPEELSAIEPFLGGRRTLPVGSELVRDWRDTLARQLRTRGELEFFVRWDHANLLEALAHEARVRATQRRLAAGVFAVTMNAHDGPWSESGPQATAIRG